jgi:cytochrome c oxidase cbb3-type subunit 3
MSTAMMRRFGGRLMAVMVLGVSFSSLVACERDASGLTEWTPADHDHQTESKTRGRNLAAVNQRKLNPRAAPSERNQVIDVTWAKQCATCHGRRGKGDGPSSTMVKARDLTNPEFQASLSDEQLKKVIREGKDKMPAFNLPDSVIDGLVQHVRGFVKKPRRGEADENDSETGTDSAEKPGPEEAAPAPNAPAAATTVEPSPAGAADKAAPSPTGSARGASPSAPSAPAKAPAPPPAHP